MSLLCVDKISEHYRVDLMPEGGDLGVAYAGLASVVLLAVLEVGLTRLHHAARLAGAELAHRRQDEREATRERQSRRDRIEAILQSEDQPEIVFQPIVSLAAGLTVGYEALSRFRLGRPDVLFAEAHQVGLGVELELKALRLAMAVRAELPDQTAYVSVNCSPTTLLAPGFTRLVEDHDLGRLVVELTEQLPIEEYGPFRATIGWLRDRGVQLAVDDAGAGYASLQHIVHLEPDIIKLDMTFTQRICTDPVTRTMVGALISFATAVDAAVVAEGVETSAQLDVLRDLGAGYGQGYLFGRPQPATCWRPVPATARR
jgi:EAL domain-containing protein (putative c-di-GMP-specific phosphodiesterase class I)